MQRYALRGIFELFDNDATGTISFENMQNVARIIGAKETPQEIQAMISTLAPPKQLLALDSPAVTLTGLILCDYSAIHVLDYI